MRENERVIEMRMT
jgi:IQ calmodulin-binding motif